MPIKASACRSVQLVPNVTLKEYPGEPHGLAQISAYKDESTPTLNRPGFGGGSLVESQATRLIRSPSSYRASNSVGGLPPQAP